MAEDKEREEGQERPSRPVTAAARRERRGTARPAARKDADGKSAKTPAAKAGSAAADRKGRPTPARDRAKDDKGSIFARIVRFLREVVAELRKVIWPTRKQMITYTAVVLVFVAFMVALVAGLDLALGKGVFWLFG
ncbi:preprotein translocase subunit SecE [Actinokineospora iranica]|uniref:Protein translocase subunit SecE n=1 Tax=Actinokineospora iranica TaxID=1271860 RepID=A0A1G6UXR3_9PSEU|nr:preprotein translocase subunit SecE [Actinokineospora iranica]SDD46051.1 preprotein translocase subunit SecE [Actinokineospora iranica]